MSKRQKYLPPDRGIRGSGGEDVDGRGGPLRGDSGFRFADGSGLVSWNYSRLARHSGAILVSITRRMLELTGAQGLNATIPEPSAENRRAVCSQSRHSLPSADGQTEDTRHEEQREQLAAPTIPPGGIFYRR
jgi:hypothetical protein